MPSRRMIAGCQVAYSLIRHFTLLFALFCTQDHSVHTNVWYDLVDAADHKFYPKMPRGLKIFLRIESFLCHPTVSICFERYGIVSWGQSRRRDRENRLRQNSAREIVVIDVHASHLRNFLKIGNLGHLKRHGKCYENVALQR